MKKERNLAAYAKSICIEAAELLEQFQWSSEYQDKEAVLDELGDVLIYCLDMSIGLEMNVEDIVRRKLKKVKYKFPTEQVKDNYDDHLVIKEKFRNK